MFCHLLNYLIRNSGNVGACLSTVDYMNRVAHAGSDDFSLDVVHLENLGNVVD